MSSCTTVLLGLSVLFVYYGATHGSDKFLNERLISSHGLDTGKTELYKENIPLDKKIERENIPLDKTSESEGSFPVVCYLSVGDKFSGPFPPEANVTLCSHIILLGTGIKNAEIAPRLYSQMYCKSVEAMKKVNPNLKVLLSNGGDFGSVLISAENRTRFANSMIPYLTNYTLDGFDLDWEFPAWPIGREHPPQQQHNYSLLLQTVRETLDDYSVKMNRSKFLLTAAVASTSPLIDNCYEIPELAKYLDFINLMTYDIHGFSLTTPFTGLNSPLHSGKSILDKTIFLNYNLVSAAEEWVKGGMSQKQVVVGIPTYGHTFELLDKNLHGVYSLAVGYNKTLGDEISYEIICGLLKNGYTEVWDQDGEVPYAYADKSWISYDNEKSVAIKAKWIKSNGYGGVMTYSLSVDDFKGKCNGIKWPLHLAIHNALKDT
ncbi:hypothetical protein SNE40_023063 [Patella caerulea]|uniref:GH18 domain-containing protein n=1 Tax=Patella caerulea TaxID=87958 RepID=A0AAN8GG47_PATCE